MSRPEHRALGVWGAEACSAWSGEEWSRAAGFPVDLTGRRRVLGFPADPPSKNVNVTPGRHTGAHRRPEPGDWHHARIVVAVVAILRRSGAG
jgi:hypothetical protein